MHVCVCLCVRARVRADMRDNPDREPHAIHTRYYESYKAAGQDTADIDFAADDTILAKVSA